MTRRQRWTSFATGSRRAVPSEGDVTSSASKSAREALDQAIRDYTRSCDTKADEKGPFVTTGWVLIASGIRGSFDDDDGTAYITESMPGQPYHTGLGLWIRGADSCRFNCTAG